MLQLTFRLSSTWVHFSVECDRMKETFLKFKYPQHLIDSTVSIFLTSMIREQPLSSKNHDKTSVVRIVLPFKDQKSADGVRKHLKNLSHKIGQELQPVFTSKKIESQLKTCEQKPTIVSQQNVFYKFERAMCDACYVGFTQRHLHQRIEQHKRPSSSVGKHIIFHSESWTLINSKF